jgi:predicted nucleotidyltransferase/DNA-binding transcriptional regulator YiaG
MVPEVMATERSHDYVLNSHIVMKPPSKESIGRKVAEARRSLGLSQARLARAVGLDRTALSKIERGARGLSALELARMAKALDRPLAWFVEQRSPPRLSDLRRRRRQIETIASHHGAHSIRIFGSVARGEARSDSDIDLLVEMGPGRSLFDRAGLLADLRDLLGREVDVATAESLRDRVRQRVLEEAVPL